MHRLIVEWDRISKTIAAAEKATPIVALSTMPPALRSQTETAPDTIEEDIDALILQEIAETPPPLKPPSPSPKPLPPPQPPRPTLKLKFNGQKLGLSKITGQSKPPKVLKPKPVHVPPSVGYSDDDSAKELILEEVLAIEEEQKGKKNKGARQMPPPPKERNLEIKRVLESTPGPSRARQSTPTPKTKKSTNGHIMPSSKGKDREVARRDASPVNRGRTPSSTHGTPVNEKKCRETLKRLNMMDEAYLFRQPVDPVLLGCPTYDTFVSIVSQASYASFICRYYDEIKEPMDLKTMGNKLDKHMYHTMEQFARDMILIFNNCRQFNPPGTDPVLQAEILENAFRKEWSKAMQKRMELTEKRSLQSILVKLRAEEWYVCLPFCQ